MVDGDKEFTASGNPKALSMDVYLQWVVDAWQSVIEDIIEHSFKVCGLMTTLDGIEDDIIHCLQLNGQIPHGLQALSPREWSKSLWTSKRT
ncbi:pogo transposable element with KRAB domain-like protein [Aphelenchoides avenae]|nr:pogo transposable element with KRAB domain-like protein [Aphelenchus avenae]